MLETKITRMLGIKYPIIGGTMMWISDADFVAAISNAGGLGIMASAMYDSRETFAQEIDRVRELTEKITQTQHELLEPRDGEEILVCTLRRLGDDWIVDWEENYYTLEDLEKVINELRKLQNATNNT